MRKDSKLYLYLIGALSIVSFFDATYLSLEQFMQAVPPCSISGCELVLSSDFSKLAIVPVALLGAIFYLVLLILVMLCLQFGAKILARLLAYFSGAGFLAALYFIFLQAFVIKSYCAYCLVADVSALVIFPTSFERLTACPRTSSLFLKSSVDNASASFVLPCA